MYKIEKEKFGPFVAQLRKEKGLTQKELAKRLFVSDKAVSKWETGASLPDTALLIPLAEILGVSATELLLSERAAQEMQTGEGKKEQSLLAEETPEGRKAAKGRRLAVLALCALMGGAGTALCAAQGPLPESVLAAAVLGLVFGVYFSFFAQERLPVYYDEYRIGSVHQGPLRMNVPGLRFNNGNWPRVVRTARIWAYAALAFGPALGALLMRTAGGAADIVLTAIVLAGLFVPVYYVGKKYE